MLPAPAANPVDSPVSEEKPEVKRLQQFPWDGFAFSIFKNAYAVGTRDFKAWVICDFINWIEEEERGWDSLEFWEGHSYTRKNIQADDLRDYLYSRVENRCWIYTTASNYRRAILDWCSFAKSTCMHFAADHLLKDEMTLRLLKLTCSKADPTQAPLIYRCDFDRYEPDFKRVCSFLITHQTRTATGECIQPSDVCYMRSIQCGPVCQINFRQLKKHGSNSDLNFGRSGCNCFIEANGTWSSAYCSWHNSELSPPDLPLDMKYLQAKMKEHGLKKNSFRRTAATYLFRLLKDADQLKRAGFTPATKLDRKLLARSFTWSGAGLFEKYGSKWNEKLELDLFPCFCHAWRAVKGKTVNFRNGESRKVVRLFDDVDSN